MAFTYVSGRACLDFMGTLKYRGGAEAEELLTRPECLSEWALHAGLVGAAVEVTEEDLAAAIAVREAGYRVVTARLEQRRPAIADVELINGRAAQPRLTPRLLGVFDTGARYQMYHALAMGLAALAMHGQAQKRARLAAIAFLTGIVLFSGSLYLLALGGARGLAFVTPVGGLAFLAGWLLLGAAALKLPRPE